MCHLSIAKIKIIYTLLIFPVIAKGFGEHDNFVFEYNQPRNCKSNEYFDIDSFSCIECDDKKNLEPSENGKVSIKNSCTLIFIIIVLIILFRFYMHL